MSTGISGLAVLVVLIGFVALVGIYAMGVYNGLVKLRNMFKNAFSQIDVQLKRRHDLIPTLVETAKAYMAHESGTLEAVIAARNGAESARQNAAANPGDAAALQKLGAAYPDWSSRRASRPHNRRYPHRSTAWPPLSSRTSTPVFSAPGFPTEPIYAPRN